MRAVLLVVGTLLLAGCILPDGVTRVHDWGPDPCRWHEVHVVVAAQAETHEQVVLSSRGGHRAMLSCIAPPELAVLEPVDGVLAGSVPRASYVEIRLVDAHGTTRLFVDPFGMENGTLDLRVIDETYEASWNGEPLEVHGMERLGHPDALDDHLFHDERALGASVWEHAFTMHSTHVADLRVTGGIQPDAEHHESADGLPSGGRLVMRLIAPDGHEAGRLAVEGPQAWDEMWNLQPQVGEWRLLVETQSPPEGVALRVGVGVALRY